MELRKIKVADMNPAAYNPRKDLKPGDAEYQHIKNSIDTFGYIDPIIWNQRTGNIVGGHQRFKILTASGAMEIDCVVVDLDDTTEKAANAALNKAQGDWDTKALEALLAELKGLDFDMVPFGFDLPEDEPEVEEDNFEVEPPEEPVAQLGDIYLLGNHRLMCGDSTKPDDVQKLMNGRQANLLVTDPPYNVDYGNKADAINKYGYHFNDRHIKNDYMPAFQFVAFLTDAFANAKEAMLPGAAFYIWHASTTIFEFEMALRNNDMISRQQLIWNKSSLVLGRQDYQWKHEPCLYGWKDGAAHFFIDDRTNTTVIEDTLSDFKKMKKDELVTLLEEIFSEKISTTIINEDKPSSSVEHPTMKPLKLLARHVKNSSKPDDLVLDLFGGSGSTLITCEQLGRTCFMMELDPRFVDVIIQRWEKQTGQKAEKL